MQTMTTLHRPTSTRGGPIHTTGSIAASLPAELIGPSDLGITGIDSIAEAHEGAITFIRSHRYANKWASSKATAALVTRGIEVTGHDPASRALLIVDNADVATVTLLMLFSPAAPRTPPGIHPTSIVDETATIGQGVHIGPGCVVGPECVIGDGSVLVANVYLGAGVAIGAITKLHPGVVILDRCVVGSACILWPNVVVGADGFGYIPAPNNRGLMKVPHIGNVIIGDGVEIGACTAIDRGKFGATTIGAGTKIDNHVQIGHNVHIGRCCIICGMTGIGGSAQIGDGVTLAGGVGVSDNITIGPGATVAAKSGIISDVPAGETWFGTPGGPHKDQMRSFAALRKLSDHLRKFGRLEKAAIKSGILVPENKSPAPYEGE